MYTRSVSPEQAPDKATYLDLEFEGGNPVAIDGQKLSPASLLTQLNKVINSLVCSTNILSVSAVLGSFMYKLPHAAVLVLHVMQNANCVGIDSQEGLFARLLC